MNSKSNLTGLASYSRLCLCPQINIRMCRPWKQLITSHIHEEVYCYLL